MSSVVRQTLAAGLAVVLAVEGPAASQSISVPVVQPLPGAGDAAGSGLSTATRGEGSEWDRARAQLRMSAATPMAQAVDRWELLARYDTLSFGDYSTFLLSYRGFPEEDKLRRSAERALERGGADPAQVVAYFDRVDRKSVV